MLLYVTIVTSRMSIVDERTVSATLVGNSGHMLTMDRYILRVFKKQKNLVLYQYPANCGRIPESLPRTFWRLNTPLTVTESNGICSSSKVGG